MEQPAAAHRLNRPDLWRRVAVTAGALAVYRLGCHIPIPGIRPEVVEQLAGLSGGGGGRERISILALGVMPWFNALIIGQLGVLMLPAVRRWRDAGGAALLSFNGAVVLLALAFACIQAAGIAAALQQVPGLVRDPHAGFTLTAALSLIGGSAAAMWLATLVTRAGIGSGFWVIFAAPMLLGLPQHIAGFSVLVERGAIAGPSALLAVGLTLAGSALMIALLMFRHRSGAQNDADVVWPPFLAGVLLGYVLLLPRLFLDADAQHTAAFGFATGSPVWFLVYALLIMGFTALCARIADVPGPVLITALGLTAVVLLPELASRIADAPVLIDGRWLVVLVAVLFSFLRLWQTAPQKRPGTVPA